MVIQGHLSPGQQRFGAVLVLVFFGASIACLALAPRWIEADSAAAGDPVVRVEPGGEVSDGPEAYSLTEHTLSEAAAQDVQSAWITRLGFLLFGFGVLLSATVTEDRWGLWGSLAHRLFGILLIGAAAFASRPWDSAETYDQVQDVIHSALVAGVGVTFTVGVLIVMLRRGPSARMSRLFDGAAIVTVSLFPMVMLNVSGLNGVVQRTVFGVGYLWHIVEAANSFLAPTRASEEKTAAGGGRPARRPMRRVRRRRRKQPSIAATTASEQSSGRLDPLDHPADEFDDFDFDEEADTQPAVTGFEDLIDDDPDSTELPGPPDDENEDEDEFDVYHEPDEPDDADDPSDLDVDETLEPDRTASPAITGDLGPEPAGKAEKGRSKRGRGTRLFGRSEKKQ